MPIVPLYKVPEKRATMLSALRGGASLAFAAETIGATLATMLGWIDRDPVFATEVDQARTVAHSSGSTPSAKPAKATADPRGDRWARIREEAAQLGPGLYGILLWVDALLATKGFPPMAPWWRDTMSEFYASGRRWLVLMVGRRGGKSSTLCRVAVVEALFGDHVRSPGDPMVWPIFSVDKKEARGRLKMIVEILGALGVEHHEGTFEGTPCVTLETSAGIPMQFRVYAATVKGARGFTAPGITCDEEAYWDDREEGRNPARDVLNAVTPTMQTQPSAHGFRCSSAFARAGTHYAAVSAGSTDTRHVARLGAAGLAIAVAGFERVAQREGDATRAQTIRAHAATLTEDSPWVPSWVTNPLPTLSAEATRADFEPWELTSWLRENGSCPASPEGETFFDAARIAAAAALEPDPSEGQCFAALDPGSRRNAFALAIVRRTAHAGARQYVPLVLREWIPAPGAPLDLRLEVLPDAARICETFGVTRWVTDAHALTDVEIVGMEHGIATRCRAEGDAFEAEYRPVRDALHRGQCPLSGCDGATELARQLRTVRSAPGNAGHTRIVIPEDDELHGDLQRAYVSACADAGAGAPPVPEATIRTLPGRYARVDPRRIR